MRVFNEIQKFDQWWVKLIYFGMMAMLLYFLYVWNIANEAVDKVEANDTNGQLLVIFSIVGVFILFLLLKLKTEIDKIGIHYQFLPFHFSKKTIRWTEIEKCYVRKYNPIGEYGGLGYRISFGSLEKVFSIKGKKGIQIVLKNGKKLLIGTQKEKEGNEIIQRYMNKQL